MKFLWIDSNSEYSSKHRVSMFSVEVFWSRMSDGRHVSSQLSIYIQGVCHSNNWFFRHKTLCGIDSNSLSIVCLQISDSVVCRHTNLSSSAQQMFSQQFVWYRTTLTLYWTIHFTLNERHQLNTLYWYFMYQKVGHLQSCILFTRKIHKLLSCEIIQ